MKTVLVKIAFELFELCLEVASCYVWVDLLDGTSVYEQLIFVKDLGWHLIQCLLDTAWAGALRDHTASSLESRTEAQTLLSIIRVKASTPVSASRYVTLYLRGFHVTLPEGGWGLSGSKGKVSTIKAFELDRSSLLQNLACALLNVLITPRAVLLQLRAIAPIVLCSAEESRTRLIQWSKL